MLNIPVNGENGQTVNRLHAFLESLTLITLWALAYFASTFPAVHAVVHALTGGLI